MIGAYQDVPAFAYPGWRLTVPGGPAGGHYKGFTHTQAAGTDIPPQDQYEQDREDGMSSHDAVHATPRNPRGVYRSSAEVPPRPNASGSAHTYQGFQTQHHPGQAVAPGSFPADYSETPEDSFLKWLLPEIVPIPGLGILGPQLILHQVSLPRPNTVAIPSTGEPVPAASAGGALVRAPSVLVTLPGYTTPVTGPVYSNPPSVPIQVAPAPPTTDNPPPPVAVTPNINAPQQNFQTPVVVGARYFPSTTFNSAGPVDAGSIPIVVIPAPATGATSTVAQPPAQPLPAPPSPSVPVVVAPPVSPQPSPVVGTNQAVPLNDGSGNYLNVTTGQVIPASDVMQNPATGQYVAAGNIPLTTAPATGTDWMAWLQESTLFSGFPNWGVVAAGLAGAALLFGGKKR